MSRSLILIIILLVAIVGAAIGLANKDTSVTPTRIEKPVDANSTAQ